MSPDGHVLASLRREGSARVVKVERPEGDFARGCDDVARGQSCSFVWLNRGKQSLVLDLASLEGSRQARRGSCNRASRNTPLRRNDRSRSKRLTGRSAKML